MTTLTVNISDEKSEKELRAFLDSRGLNYSIDSTDWWKNKDLVNELNKRSNDLKNGKDKGISFNDIKNSL